MPPATEPWPLMIVSGLMKFRRSLVFGSKYFELLSSISRSSASRLRTSMTFTSPPFAQSTPNSSVMSTPSISSPPG